MSETTDTQASQSPQAPPEVKTKHDLQIEELTRKLAELETRYNEELREAQEANRELWAALHPVEQPSADAQPPDVADDPGQDAALSVFKKKMGIE